MVLEGGIIETHMMGSSVSTLTNDCKSNGGEVRCAVQGEGHTKADSIFLDRAQSQFFSGMLLLEKLSN